MEGKKKRRVFFLLCLRPRLMHPRMPKGVAWRPALIGDTSQTHTQTLHNLQRVLGDTTHAHTLYTTQSAAYFRGDKSNGAVEMRASGQGYRGGVCTSFLCPVYLGNGEEVATVHRSRQILRDPLIRFQRSITPRKERHTAGPPKPISEVDHSTGRTTAAAFRAEKGASADTKNVAVNTESERRCREVT